jgi:methylase of polypeptide subunit release factors
MPTAGPAARRVGELLREAGYTAPALERLLRPTGDALVDRGELPVYRRRLAAEQGALQALARLFLLGDAVAADEAERALGAAVLSLLELGLAHEADGAIVPDVEIVPHDDVLIASDGRAEGLGAAFVPGVQPPSALLAMLTVRRPVARALDLGTGNGLQAILVSRYAERVVASDVSERALAFAELNAALNGVTNIELRHGSFFEPVAGERFGLAVSNPPYVVSPETAYLYRDSGLGRDRVSEHVIGGLAGLLEDGGFATALVSWIVDADTDTDDAPKRWLESSGCAAWILHTRTDEPLGAAGLWNRPLRGDPDAFDAAVGRWVDYFAAEQVAGIAYGGVVLRRGEPAWVRSTKLPIARTTQAGDHLQRLFAGTDWQLAHDDTSLRVARLRPVAAALVEQVARPHESRWQTSAVDLVHEGGLGFRAGLDGPAAALVTALDGSRTVDEALALVAAAGGNEAGALALVRELVSLGFYVPE